MASQQISNLQKVTSNVEELKRRKLDVTSKMEELEQGDACSSCKPKLGYLKQQFNSLKNTAIELQSKLKLLECLAEGEDKWLETYQEDEGFKTSRENLRKLKELADDKKNKLTEDLEKVERAYKTYLDRMHSLTEQLEEVESKKRKLETSLQNSAVVSEKLGILSENNDDNILPQLPVNIEEKERELKEVQASIKQCEETSHKIKEKMMKFKEMKDSSQRLLEESKRELKYMDRERSMKDQKAEQDMQWCDSILSQMSALSGFKEHSVSGHTLTIEYLNSGDNEDSKLLLSMAWKLGKYGRYILDKAEINLESLDVSSIINYAIENDDVVYMINEIRKTWEKHLPLRKEIVDLRQLYAIDWIPSEGIIRQMVGDGGHIVCTLKLDSTAQGAENITLIKIEGSGEENMDDLKPAGEKSTIYEWLEFLQVKYGKP